ncbi:MAG: tRNA (N6-isopentenyl adenosine(37)-C2)-methylthiotransferase MiaB [Kiritimatiellae bacterium]|nr:tRNA (N6-isopentenyl adenosine(37)-C2)-methylthiotransferase MiaB [Kiritimatiellia bacterium]
MKLRRYHIWTIGCQMNEADSRHLAAQLERLGLEAVAEPVEADLVVLNTCVVRQQAENKIYGKLGSLRKMKQQRPHLVIALMGCLVGVKDNPALRAKYPYVDVFVPPSGVDRLVNHLLTHVPALSDRSAPDSYDLPALERHAVTAFVPAVLGCSHACAYCVIPLRRGAEQSRPAEEVLHEVSELVRQGVREVMLLGQIVDRYGLDRSDGPDLADLLNQVCAIPELLRVRFLTSHPNWMTDKLLDAVASEPKICPQLEVAAQSGNNEVLRRMRRGYTREKYLDLVARIRRRIPDAAIHTDIIVGFPGETEEQYRDSYRLLEEVEFDKVHIAKYSPRPGTTAAQETDDVSEEVKERRRKELDDFQKTIQERKNAALRGCLLEVLVESEQKGRWQGRTPQNKIVFFEGAESGPGRLEQVRIEWTGPFSMIGKMELP